MATKRKAAASKLKPLPRGARSSVLKDTASLLSHASHFAREVSRGTLAEKVTEAVATYDELRVRRPDRTACGRGAPPKTEITVLVSFLATAFSRATGRPASRRWDDELSLFEGFVEPILLDLGIVNVGGTVKKHVRLRNCLAAAPAPGAPPKI